MDAERDDGIRPELQAEGVVPTESVIEPDEGHAHAVEGTVEPAPWAHTAVASRFRVNTAEDRLTALSEAFRVFFERTDGTNALDD